MGKVRLSCFAASQEVGVSRPLIGRQNTQLQVQGWIQGSEVAPGHTAKQGNTGSVASTLPTTLPCLSLPALPLSPISMPCLPLLRWPNNSLLSVGCLEATCLQPKSCCMPGCREEDSIPRTEALRTGRPLSSCLGLHHHCPTLTGLMLPVEKLVPRGG